VLLVRSTADSGRVTFPKASLGASTGDPAASHIRIKTRQEALARRSKDPIDPLPMMLFRDMWLTDFAVPCLPKRPPT
jgi:type I restriction enzyme, R subunit